MYTIVHAINWTFLRIHLLLFTFFLLHNVVSHNVVSSMYTIVHAINWTFLRIHLLLFTFFLFTSFLFFFSLPAFVGNTRIQSDYTSRCVDRKYFTLICKKLILIEYQYKTKAAMYLQRWWRNTYYTTIFVHTVEMELQRHTKAAKAIQSFFRAKNLMFLLKLWVVHYIGHVESFQKKQLIFNQPTSVV